MHVAIALSDIAIGAPSQTRARQRYPTHRTVRAAGKVAALGLPRPQRDDSHPKREFLEFFDLESDEQHKWLPGAPGESSQDT